MFVRAALVISALNPTLARATVFDDIGYTTLKNTLATIGVTLPKGAGVPISQVEAGGNSHNSYFPNPANSEFIGATLVDASENPSHINSNHATNMGRVFFGNVTSVAPDANHILVYEAGLFLQNQLKAPTGGAIPDLEGSLACTPGETCLPVIRVQNHSWVGSFAADDNNPTSGELTEDVYTLRRFDYWVNRDDVTAVVGVNNGASSTLPRLLSSSYNAMAVGRTDGLHSAGQTALVNYGLGRHKPDIVAPRNTSSAATAQVSSVATFLHGVVAGTDAAKNEPMKAIIMAGATKNEFPGWTRNSTQPLDLTFGAGEVNIFNSYLITQGGQFAGTNAPETAVGNYGWDYQTALPGEGLEKQYKFVVPEGTDVHELSIMLAWNVNVQSNFNGQSLADLNLLLTNSLGETVDSSVSTVENVEHIHLLDLAPGDYTLTITTDIARDYGLAWRMSTSFLEDSADFDNDGDVDGRDFLTWQRNFGKLVNATHAQGDADGDGDVDADDVLVVRAQYGPVVETPPLLVVTAIPEPATAVLVSGGVLTLFLARKRWK